MGLVYGGQGVVPSARGQATTVLSLSAGQVSVIPAGSWGVGTGLYSSLQEFDPVTGIWRNIGNDAGTTFRWINSDGVNFRVANQTGCVVGVLVTTAGAGYTSAPVVTDSASNSVLTASTAAVTSWLNNADANISGTHNTIASGGWVNFSIVADGTSKKINCVLTTTR